MFLLSLALLSWSFNSVSYPLSFQYVFHFYFLFFSSGSQTILVFTPKNLIKLWSQTSFTLKKALKAKLRKVNYLIKLVNYLINTVSGGIMLNWLKGRDWRKGYQLGGHCSSIRTRLGGLGLRWWQWKWEVREMFGRQY